MHNPEVTGEGPLLLPRPAYLDLIDEHASVARLHRRRAWALLVLPAVVGLVVGAAATVAFLPVWAAVLAGCVLAVVLSVWARRAAPGIVLRSVGARDPRPGELVRVDNMLEELSLTVGVPRPAVYVADSAQIDILAVGLDARRSSLVVTSGFVDGLDVMETEALLAHGLVRIKDHLTAPATVAVTTLVPLARVLPGPGRALWCRLGPEMPEETDYRTVRVTHYPPGLLQAFGTMQVRHRTSTPGLPGGAPVAHLWTAPDEAPPTLPVEGAAIALRRAILEEI